MEIAIIIAFAIVLLQTIVIYGLGNRYTQAIKQIKELELDLQDHITGSDKDARTITALRRTIEELTKERDQLLASIAPPNLQSSVEKTQ